MLVLAFMSHEHREYRQRGFLPKGTILLLTAMHGLYKKIPDANGAVDIFYNDLMRLEHLDADGNRDFLERIIKERHEKP